jgi:curli production assembly/transport component CsgG
MKKTLVALTIISMLSGCAIMQSTGLIESMPEVTSTVMQKEFDAIPSPAAGKPVSVAVYSFQDKTGQRRPQANVASLSTAVTQGAETFLIKALQDVGRGEWFEVVERVGIDNLTKERLIIRQMREAYEGNNAKPLMPMQFAGMIIEGGIIGYDTSINSGGAGMRIFGIGKQTQWSQDVVTVSLRATSVNTGKILMAVTVQKTILSSADSTSALKFFDTATQAFEAEAGLTINEPGTYAVKSTVELAVVELIKEGQRKGIWDYKKNIPVAQATVPTVEKLLITEEKKDELVQPQTIKTPTAPNAPVAAPQQSSDRSDAKGNEGESKGNETKAEIKPSVKE